MSFLNEFKDFAMRGNVMDMAIGVVIGGAFGQITTSLVNNIIMPPLGMLIAARHAYRQDRFFKFIHSAGRQGLSFA